jgi:hypothetical protein
MLLQTGLISPALAGLVVSCTYKPAVLMALNYGALLGAQMLYV